MTQNDFIFLRNAKSNPKLPWCHVILLHVLLEYEFLTEVFLFHRTASSKSAKEAFLRFKNVKGCKEGNKSPTELRVMALAYILRIVLNGLLWPPWWAFVWCFGKLKTLQRRFFPVLQGNCDNPFSLTPFKRLFKGQSIRKCVVRI